MKSKVPAVGKSDSPAALACGMALRTVRMDRGVGLRRLADKLGLCAATLSAWELGQRVPDSDGVARALGFLQVKSAECARILELCRGIADPNLVEIPNSDTAPLLWTYERIVAEFTEWAPRVVPELLQTADYAKLLLKGGLSNQDDVDQEIFTRVTRQDIFRRRESPTSYIFFIGEAALSHHRVTQAVMLEQLRHVHSLTSLPHVSIRILSTMNTSDCIDRFILCRNFNRSLVAILRHGFGNIYLAKAEQVEGWRKATRTLGKLALNNQASRDLISSKIAELESVDQLERIARPGETDQCA